MVLLRTPPGFQQNRGNPIWFAAPAGLLSMKRGESSAKNAQVMSPPNRSPLCGRKGTSMKRYMQAILMTIVLIGSSIAAFAGDVRTDYDHSVNFSQYSTYSWGKVQTSNPFFASRIQQAVDNQLQAKGWKL